MKKADCLELRRIMLDKIEELDPDRKACLALSGGVDSVTVLFAMLESGRKPRCYTFYAKDYPSEDLLSARRLCDDFGLELVEVPVPVDHDSIVADLKVLVHAHQADKIKKTIVQCMHPWMYVCPEMQKRGDDFILIGFAAGNYYALSRRDGKKLRELGEEEFKNQGHRNHNFRGGTSLQFVDANVAQFCGRYGIHMDDFYAYDEIQEWMKQFTTDELHRDEHGNRFEKAVVVYAFHDYYEKGPYYRKGSSYQINSKIRDFHDGLLWNPRYNPSGAKAIIRIYRDIAEGRVS